MANIKAAIRKALAGATSQQPVGTAKLYALGTHEQVEAALLELYQAHEAGCCKITRGGIERIVWWPTGASKELGQFGRNLGHRTNREARDVHP